MALTKTPIPFDKTKIFSKIFLDFSAGRLSDLYPYESSLEGIKAFTEQNSYDKLDRVVLAEELQRQNAGIELSALSKENIESLKNKNTYTITTGHQLCLATGPLYFIYKILSVINLSEKLNAGGAGKRFVPVYWMASEDHDVEEINHVNLFNKKFTWSTTQKGRVGEFNLEGIDGFLSEIGDVLGENEQAKIILALLKKAYAQKDLATATRYLVNELFGKYGLVILDGNTKAFKQQFVAEIKRDVFENFAFKKVNETLGLFKQKGYEAQVNPREINCFYADAGLRERIVEENSKYKVLNTDLVFSKDELEKKIETETEKFSPNVVMRPLFQQKILPNAAYVGGPGELAYWLQYKTMFEEANIPYPVLVARDFILYIEKGLQQRMEKLNLQAADFFGDKEKLIKDFALQQQPLDLSADKESLKKLFEEAKAKLAKADKTLEAATEAELQKNLKSLDALEQKGVRAIKQKSEQSINQIEAIYGRLFPNGVPQERVENFLRFYLSNPAFIEQVKNAGGFFEKSVSVLTEN